MIEHCPRSAPAAAPTAPSRAARVAVTTSWTGIRRANTKAAADANPRACIKVNHRKFTVVGIEANARMESADADAPNRGPKAKSTTSRAKREVKITGGVTNAIATPDN